KAPATWASIKTLNEDILKIVPLLLADGSECKAASADAKVEVRARKTGKGWLLIVVNTDRSPAQASIDIDGLSATNLRSLDGMETITSSDGNLQMKLAPLEVRVFISAGSI